MEEALNFVCPSKDCNQKAFSDEKQLISHRKKHEMVLCLNKPNQYSSDQTPTPTRFIRNCEAIGLFQDLQNVNPFDENFKKAAEAVRKGERIWMPSVSTLGKAAGEDLHTPHVDLTDDTQSSNNGNDEDKVEDYGRVIRTEADTSYKTSSDLSQATPVPLIDDNREASKAAQDLRVYVRMPDGILVQIPTIPEKFAVPNCQSNSSGAVIIPSQVVQNGGAKPSTHPTKTPILPPKPQLNSAGASDIVKQKLKAALLKSVKVNSRGANKSTSEPPAVLVNQHAKVNINSTEAKKVTSSTSVDEDHDRKQKTLERNRIAASRCREKRKKWVAELREKYDKMCATNEALVRETAFLRSEVARLKGLLIASCSQNEAPELSTATVQLVPSISTKVRLPRHISICEEENTQPPSEIEATLISGGRIGRESLRLDIEGATRATVMDLDSPLVRSDEILSSVAPPTTPNERLISFPDLDRIGDGDICEEKMLPTVIQINPNALSKLPSAFS